MNQEFDYDVIVAGGGPAGATAAIVLARAGVRTLLVERTAFPRFHIGESLLPRNFSLFCELGLEQKVRDLPHVPKWGVQFETGDASASVVYPFTVALIGGTESVNLERAPFDKMLLETAAESGATVLQASVKKIERLADGDVSIQVDDRSVHAKWFLDASGQGTLVGRHLGIRKNYTDPRLQKVAYYAHFENVFRDEGDRGGYPLIIMCDEGWFWFIPLDEKKTSVGLVIHADAARTLDLPADRRLFWGIERCPAAARRMKGASGPQTNYVSADFSYACRPYAGPGYFLIGDAATFLDPIFSTGVCLAMLAGQHAASQVIQLLGGRTSPEAARRRHIRFIDGSSGVFFKLIRQYYDHSFRELFLSGGGPLQVHRAILAILAGNVFPRPPFCLRWRFWFFEMLRLLNRYLPIVEPRNRFSLLGEISSPAIG